MNRHSFIDKLSLNALRYPNRVAFGYRLDQAWTFSELYQISLECIKQLNDIQFSVSDRVGLYLSNRPMYVLIMPSLYAKVISASLKGSFNDEQLIAACLDRKLNVIMSDKVTQSLVEACKTHHLGLVELQYDQGIKMILKVDYTRNLDTLEEDPIIFINNSSGTTGKAKTFPRRLSEVLAIIDQEATIHQCNEASVRLLTAYVDSPSNINNILKAIFLGATVYGSDGIDPQLIHTICHQAKIKHIRLSPAGMQTLFDDATSRKIDYHSSSLKKVIVTGAAIQPTFVERYHALFSAPLIHTYGSTETSNIASNYNAPKGYKQGSVGIVHLHDIKIIDDEICVKAPMVFKGYESFDNSTIFIDGYFRTGDHGSLDEDGYLFIHGRLKELINRGGEKVSPIKIEHHIDQLQWFQECVVFSFLNKDGIEDIACLVVIKDRSYSIKEIRDALMKSIPAYHCPTHVIEVPFIEKTSANKVSRKALSERYKDQLLSDFESTEDALALIKGCLNQPKLNVLDSFTSWGGDSIKYASLMSLVQYHLHKQVILSDLMACASIQDMIQLIEATPTHQKRYDLTWLRKVKSSYPTLIFVHPKSGDIVTYRYVMQHIREDIAIGGLTFDPLMFDQAPPYDASQVIEWYKQAIIGQGLNDVILCGLSVGGKIALWLAQALKEASINVKHVIMLDTTFVSHVYERKWHPQRTLSLFMFDMKTKRFGTFPNYLKTKVRQLVNNRLMRKNTISQAQASLEEKLAQSLKEFTSYEIEQMISNIFKESMMPSSDVDVIYLHATRERGDMHIRFIENHVRSLKLIKVNCYHSDFVDIKAETTASIINDIISSS